jgi:hypothetical protein
VSDEHALSLSAHGKTKQLACIVGNPEIGQKRRFVDISPGKSAALRFPEARTLSGRSVRFVACWPVYRK